MDEKLASEILGDSIIDGNDLEGGMPYIGWNQDMPKFIELDGTFVTEDLEAIIWWTKNKGRE